MAKAFEGEQGDPNVTNSPTLSMAATQQGVILGTAAYMSPEQAKGLPVDRRTDVFAFGCVLFEMLTGRQAFRGELVTEIMASVIHQEPDYSGLQPDLNPRVVELLRRCFAKTPKDRWQAIGDVRFELDAVMSDPSGVSHRAAAPHRSRSGLPWVAALVVAACIAGVAGWMLKPTPPSALSTVARLSITLPPGQFLAENALNFDVSPDGTRFTYVSNGQLYVRAIDDPEPAPLSGTTGAGSPFFSPDADWIGFYAEGQLRKVATVGGVPEPLWDVGGSALGGSWAPDDTIDFAPSNTSGIWKVAASGGVAEPVTALDREAGEISHRWPQALPGAVLFTVWTGPGFAEKRVELHVLETGERRIVAPGGDTGRYVPSGHVVYSLQGDQVWMAVPFDVESLRVTGRAGRLDDAVARGIEGALYAVSESGVLAHITADPGVYRTRLAWVDRDGAIEPIGSEGSYSNPRLSPDGQFAAVMTWGPTMGISIYDFSRGLFTPIRGEGSNQFPRWHPDGRDILYRGTRSGFRNVYRRAADGSGSEAQLTTSDNLQRPWTISADGWLVFGDVDPETGNDLWAIQLDGENREPQEFLVTQARERLAQFSPDGRSVAYTSDASGQSEVFVRPFPEREPRILVGVATDPVWSSDGRELFYLDPSGEQLMVANVDGSGPDLVVGNPSVLVRDWPGEALGSGHPYDVSADGRFLTMVPVQPGPPPNEITVVLNWHQELTERVPVP